MAQLVSGAYFLFLNIKKKSTQRYAYSDLLLPFIKKSGSIPLLRLCTSALLKQQQHEDRHVISAKRCLKSVEPTVFIAQMLFWCHPFRFVRCGAVARGDSFVIFARFAKIVPRSRLFFNFRQYFCSLQSSGVLLATSTISNYQSWRNLTSLHLHWSFVLLLATYVTKVSDQCWVGKTMTCTFWKYSYVPRLCS